MAGGGWYVASVFYKGDFMNVRLFEEARASEIIEV